MSKIKCEVEYSSQENDYGTYSECIVATCPKCGHETTSWGSSESSVKRCLVLLNEECPEGENNFYVEA